MAHAAAAQTGRCSAASKLNATSSALPSDAESGNLGEAIAPMSTGPKDVPDAKSTADIMVHPSGEPLLGPSMRIAVFRLDEQGVPKRVQLVAEDIAFPRVPARSGPDVAVRAEPAERQRVAVRD